MGLETLLLVFGVIVVLTTVVCVRKLRSKMAGRVDPDATPADHKPRA